MKAVQQRLEQKRIKLSISDEAYEWLAQVGFDPLYGARPLKRVIQREVLNPLSKELIAGNVKPNETLYLKVNQGNLELTHV
jgi:ATP-dependent Clp protease ATP-binding subunit ClpB